MGIKKLIFIPMLYGCLSIFLFPSHDASARICDEYIHPVYLPMQEALDALESDEYVTVSQVFVGEWASPDNFYYKFEPITITPTIGFIIYPGACVDPGAYAPAAHAIAAEGYLTVIVKMIEDIALQSDSHTRAAKIINDHPGIEEWAIGGHSLGGVAACAYIYGDPNEGNPAKDMDGAVMWASYPALTNSLVDKIIKAISIYGTNDGLVTADEIETSRLYLPPYTEWEDITGGNHTQFGYYWDGVNENFLQPDDNPADITREEQQNIIIQATVDFLDHFTLCSNDPENDYDNDNVCGDIDNCPFVANAGQEDGEADGVGDACDNCSARPNGPALGTCVNLVSGVTSSSGTTCSDDADCVVALGETCDLAQEDSYPPGGNNCGDACECYADIAATFGKVDLNDLVIMKGEFLKTCPPSPCTADLNGDNKVDLKDLVLMKREFNRSGCPTCT